MILLDTNVLSEFMRPAPTPQVVAWLDAQPTDRIWVSAITRAEIELGVALLPEGRCKLGLQQAVSAMFVEDFAGRCLPFDEVAAPLSARIVANARAKVDPSPPKMQRLLPLPWRMV